MWGVVTVVFLLFNILPGDPARMMLDQREDTEQLNNINDFDWLEELWKKSI